MVFPHTTTPSQQESRPAGKGLNMEWLLFLTGLNGYSSKIFLMQIPSGIFMMCNEIKLPN